MAAQDGHEDSSKVILSLCAGANLTNGQIVFSHDSKYFSCCSGWTVKVYNTINGQCAQVLQGHRDLVTGLALNPANKLQLFSCGLDGVIHQWIYIEGVLLRTYSFYMPLHALITVDSSGSFVSAIAQRPQTTSCCLLRLPLRKDKKQTVPQEGTTEAAIKTGDIMLPACEADHRTVSYGCSEQYIAAVQGQNLWLYSCKRKTHRKLTTEAGNPFTCVACHPTDSCLATGHANGKITLWWNISSKDKVVMSTNHWHSLPVHCLAFTPEGSCLLSGGHECVLVRWQMNSEHKDFLPRLGAPLHSITSSPDGALFVTSHTDNVLQVITSSFGIVHAMRGLARAHLGASSSSLARPMPVGLVCDPRSGALVTNGRPGHLQFYCMDTDCQLYNLDIVGQNYVSPDNLQTPTTITEVEQAAFDPSGDWLATFQRWEDGVLTPEYCLKFWRYNKKQQNYQLNTTVEMPHYKAVRCLRFKPGKSQSPVMVSTGDDGFFKLWSMVTETHHGKSVHQWTCESMGHYRGRPATVARFSSDGKMLAVVFDNVLTLWDPHTNVFLDKFVFDHPLLCVEFGGGSSANFILVTTNSHLTVLDRHTLSVHMQMSMPDAILATDGDLVCAVTGQQDLYIFRPNEDKLLLHKKKVTMHPVISAAFLPAGRRREGEEEDELGWQSQSRLYLLDSQQMLFTPTLSGNTAQTPRSRMQVQLKQVLPQTPFQALLNSSHRQQEKDTASPTAGQGDHRAVRPLAGFDVLNVRVTTEESFSKNAQRMLDTMMLRRKGHTEPMDVEQEQEREEEDVAMVTNES